MGLPTKAAHATLVVSKTEFASDKAFAMGVSLGVAVSIDRARTRQRQRRLATGHTNVTITQRYTILRTLCGMDLHKALDEAHPSTMRRYWKDSMIYSRDIHF